MKIFILVDLLIIFIFPSNIRYLFTILLSIAWFLYTIYFIYKLSQIKDKKIVVNKYSANTPNNTYSPYIRFFYSGKIDYKVFTLIIYELILKGSISLYRHDKDIYYLVDNKVPDEVLNKSELTIKNILFKNIGSDNRVSLNTINRESKKNSGYFYSLYKEWQEVFDFECAKNKYFKRIKPIIDSSVFYFIISLIISLYNIFFTRLILVSLIIFFVTMLLIKSVNDYKNIEDDKKDEYKEWLGFKNYIKKEDNTLWELDNSSLENYSMYAYALDEYESFIKVLSKKYVFNNKAFDNNIILSIMNYRVFDDIDKSLINDLRRIKRNTVLFFARNKGKSRG